MQDIRSQFRDFLLRLANNSLCGDDWDTVATQYYADGEIE